MGLSARDGKGEIDGLANDTLTLDLDEGTYSLELTEVADNCAVTGENPVSVDIAFDLLASAQFEVVCSTVEAGEE